MNADRIGMLSIIVIITSIAGVHTSTQAAATATYHSHIPGSTDTDKGEGKT